MLDHDIVSFLAIPFFQCVIISQMFIHSSLDTSFCGKGILRGLVDQVQQALEDVVEFIIVEIAYDQKMVLMVIINEIFQGIRI